MSGETTVIIIGTGVALLSFLALGVIFSRTNKFFRLADEIENKAKQAKTPKELEDNYMELRKLAKQSWHNQTGQRINEIKILIETKHQLLKERENEQNKIERIGLLSELDDELLKYKAIRKFLFERHSHAEIEYDCNPDAIVYREADVLELVKQLTGISIDMKKLD